MLRRVVEPDLFVWIDRPDVGAWAERLVAEPARRAPGRVTVQLVPDPFVLTLASEDEGIRLADAVQLYLGCRLIVLCEVGQIGQIRPHATESIKVLYWLSRAEFQGRPGRETRRFVHLTKYY